MLLSQLDLSVISEHQPESRPDKSLLRASVAIILRDGEQGTEFLMMQRAKHEQDPWSGQMSFPGGKIDSQDQSAKAAAIREAREEVGIELSEQDYIGQLDDLYGLKVDGRFSVHVSSFVFKPATESPLVPNHEVADLVWVPFSHMGDPNNEHDFYHPYDKLVKMPAVMINAEKDQILWGMSLRMMSMFYDLIDKPMAVLSEQAQQTMRELDTRSLDSKKIGRMAQKIARQNN